MPPHSIDVSCAQKSVLKIGFLSPPVKVEVTRCQTSQSGALVVILVCRAIEGANVYGFYSGCSTRIVRLRGLFSLESLHEFRYRLSGVVSDGGCS